MRSTPAVSCRDVAGITAGLYQFDPFANSLIGCERVTPRSERGVDIAERFVHGDVTVGAAVIMVFVGVFARNRSKYGQRALRFTLIETGHAAQNALLSVLRAMPGAEVELAKAQVAVEHDEYERRIRLSVGELRPGRIAEWSMW